MRPPDTKFMDLFGKKSPIVLISHFAMAYAALTITQTSDAQTVNGSGNFHWRDLGGIGKLVESPFLEGV